MPIEDITPIAAIQTFMEADDAAAACAAIGAAPQIDVTNYGAVADAKGASSASITSGAAVLTISASMFSAGDVGKFIRVENAGVDGADLETTISAYTSATQVILSATASNTVSGVGAYWGTDNTDAFTDAMTAAAASNDTHAVYVPGGAYIANVEIPKAGMVLRGVGSYDTVANPTGATFPTASGSASTIVPTTRTVATIRNAGDFWGCLVERLRIYNGASVAQRGGIALEIGNSSPAAEGYPGATWIVRQLSIWGAEYGVNVARAGSGEVSQCAFQWVGTLFNLDEIPQASSDGIADNLFIAACTGSYMDTILASTSGKGTFLTSGDFNYPKVAFKLFANASLTIGTINIEGDVDYVALADVREGSHFTAGHIQTLSVTPIVRVMDKTGNELVDIKSCSNNTSVYYYTTGTEYPKDIAGGYVGRFADETFAVRKRWEKTTELKLSASEKMESLLRSMTEDWRDISASPYGDWKWDITSIGGGIGIRDSTTSGTNVEIYSTSTSATNSARIMPTRATWWFPNKRRLFLPVKVSNPANAVVRIGMYSRDGSASMTPTHGIGLKIDASVDTTIKWEFRNGATVTEVDSGLTLAAADAYGQSYLVIEKTNSGFACCLLDSTGTVRGEQKHITCTPGNSLVSPAIFTGVATTNWSQVSVWPGGYITDCPSGTKEFIWVNP